MSANETSRYFVPGPSWVREEIRQAMMAPVVPHRSACFLELYASLQPRLQALFRTDDEVLVATGSATLAMEIGVFSTVSGSVLNLVGGAFSERWHRISLANGLQAEKLEFSWGEGVDPEAVRQTLRKKKVDAVTVVHNETSTGVMNPLEDIAQAVREESDALVLVDTVSSLAGAPVETRGWELDFVVTGSQKALALPPGLALFTASTRAEDAAQRRTCRGFYTDLLRYLEKHRGGGTITTPAIPLFYALDLQLKQIAEEGLEKRWQRHRALSERTAEWAEMAGFEYASDAACRSWTVSCLRPPDGVTAPALVDSLESRGFQVGRGYGPWKASTFRIGHMGDIDLEDLERLLAAIDDSVAGSER